MAEALAEVKRVFGEDAMILHTRTVERRTVLGLGRKPLIEVIAASAISDLPRGSATGNVPAPTRAGNVRVSAAEGAATAMPTVRPGNPAPRLPNRPDLGALRAEIDALKQQIKALAPPMVQSGARRPEELAAVYRQLAAGEVAREIADQLVERLCRELAPEKLNNAALVRERLGRYVADMLPAGGEITLETGSLPRVVALVGPTGVGKTTTVAKLAADFALRKRRHVGLITLDTRRIGAIEQLRTCAEIIGVRLCVASGADELRSALSALADAELVLIDTPGCSPGDDAAFADLETRLGAAGAEVHLTLSVNASPSALRLAVEAFAALKPQRMVFTKLDEAVGCGVMLECLRQAQARLSYVSTGQNVAGDLAVGRSEQLARLIVGEAV